MPDDTVGPKYCPQCGKYLGGDTDCPRCGTRTVKKGPYRCPDCGKLMFQELRCTECGYEAK